MFVQHEGQAEETRAAWYLRQILGSANIDGGRLLDGMVRLVPPRHIETSVAIWCEIDRIIGRYLRGLVLESLGGAVLATVGLWALGVPALLLLGAFAGIVNPLPYVGVLLSLTVALATALGAGMAPDVLLAVVGLFVVILSIGSGIRRYSDEARQTFPGDRITALMAVVDCESCI